MTKEAVLQQFFERFMTAYPSSQPPVDTIFPYLVYERTVDNWEGEEINIPVHMWFYTESEAIPNAKAQELAEAVDASYPIKCDGGYVWFKRGHPWVISASDDTAPGVKLREINVSVEYLTFH